MEFGFLILHYRDLQVTLECIDSIRKLDSGENKIFILIVDNCSRNGTGEALQKKFEQEKQIQVLILDDSSGFSNGNNIGYKYIKSNIPVDFLIVTNNDILFNQTDMLEKIKDIYLEQSFHVLGPDIYVPVRNCHDNPHYEGLRDVDYVKSILIKMNKRKKMPVGRAVIYDFIQSSWWYVYFRKYIYPYTKKGRINISNALLKKENVCLSGACFIFSKSFIDINDEIFSPETRFYWEEEILYYKCILNKWKILYDPGIHVLHHEGVSTRAKYRNTVKRRKEKLTYNIESAKIYLDFIEKNPIL